MRLPQNGAQNTPTINKTREDQKFVTGEMGKAVAKLDCVCQSIASDESIESGLRPATGYVYWCLTLPYNDRYEVCVFIELARRKTKPVCMRLELRDLEVELRFLGFDSWF